MLHTIRKRRRRHHSAVALFMWGVLAGLAAGAAVVFALAASSTLR